MSAVVQDVKYSTTIIATTLILAEINNVHDNDCTILPFSGY
jgi:hypothetical protein